MHGSAGNDGLGSKTVEKSGGMPESGQAAHTDHDAIGRNARARRAILVALASAPTLVSTACLSPRPEFLPPRPSSAIVEPSAVDVEPAAAIDLPSASAVAGDIRFVGGPSDDVDLGPVVVHLVPLSAGAAASPDLDPVPIRSGTPEFSPDLVAAARGQAVVFSNDGPLAHRLFSAEMGEARIDLPAGARSKPVRVPARGPVRFFCSLHSDETFLVYSSPADHVAVVRAGQSFAFQHVAPGRYRLEIWSDLVAGRVREFIADGYTHRTERVWIDTDIVRRLMAARADHLR